MEALRRKRGGGTAFCRIGARLPARGTDVVRRLCEHVGEAAIPVPVWHELRFGGARLPPSRCRKARCAETVVFDGFPMLDYDRAASGRPCAECARLGACRQDAVVCRQADRDDHVCRMITSNTQNFEDFRGHES